MDYKKIILVAFLCIASQVFGVASSTIVNVPRLAQEVASIGLRIPNNASFAFSLLSDVPNTSGHTGEYLQFNGTGFIWNSVATPTSASWTFSGLSDIPTSTAQAGKYLQVKNDETGYQWGTPGVDYNFWIVVNPALPQALKATQGKSFSGARCAALLGKALEPDQILYVLASSGALIRSFGAGSEMQIATLPAPLIAPVSFDNNLMIASGSELWISYGGSDLILASTLLSEVTDFFPETVGSFSRIVITLQDGNLNSWDCREHRIISP